MRIKGTITKWNDERGFGFIMPEGGGRDVFVHISAFPSDGNQPSESMRVTFELGTDSRGRSCARNARYANRRKNLSPQARAVIRRLAVSLLFLAFLEIAVAENLFPRKILVIYLVASFVSPVFYAWDKAAAVAGRRRVPEQTLHVLDLAGGWPGALVAQQMLRHKTRKPSFRLMFWLTVVINCALLYYLATPDGAELLGTFLDSVSSFSQASQ